MTAGPPTNRWPRCPSRRPGPTRRRGPSRARWRTVVLAALARLPLSLRVPVVLRYYADLSERDIALAIGRRQGTVKSRLHEARRRLAADPVLCALAGAGDLTEAGGRGGDGPMTMLDDDQLASLFVRAGEAFDVPASGAADIVARATGAVARGCRRRGRRATVPPTRREATTRPTSARPARAGPGGAGAPVGRHGRPAPGAVGGRLPGAAARGGRHGRRADAVHLGAVAERQRGAHRARAPARPRVPAAPATTVPSAASGVGLALNSKRPPRRPTNGYSTRTQSNAQLGASTPAATVPTSPTAPSLPSGAVGQSSKIEQTGSLGLTVRKGALGRTMTRLTALAGSAGGFVASSQTQTGARRGRCALRQHHAAGPGGHLRLRAEAGPVLRHHVEPDDPRHQRHRPVRQPAGADLRPADEPSSST